MELTKNSDACKALGFWTTAELGYAINCGQLPIGIAIPPGANGNKQWIVKVYKDRLDRYTSAKDMGTLISTNI